MTSTATPRRRAAAIDVARAVSVTSIVMYHVVYGLEGADLISGNHPLAVMSEALAAFRLPLLGFILGLFIPGGVAKRGARGYLINRIALVGYLYLLWYVLQSSVEVLTSDLKNMPREPDQLFTFWVMFAHLWFLPFLIVASVIVVLTRPWASPVRGVVVVGALLVVSLAAWGWNPDIIGLRGFSDIVFVALGAVVGFRRMAELMQRSPWGWTAAGAVAVALLALRVVYGLPVTAGSNPTGVVVPFDERLITLGTALAGMVATLAVAVLITRMPRVASAVKSVGTRTMSIYLAHVMLVAGTRIVLVDLGVTRPYVLFAVCSAVGVLGPLAVAVFVERRAWASWLFDLPAPVWARVRPYTFPARPAGQTASAGATRTGTATPVEAAAPAEELEPPHQPAQATRSE